MFDLQTASSSLVQTFQYGFFLSMLYLANVLSWQWYDGCLWTTVWLDTWRTWGMNKDMFISYVLWCLGVTANWLDLKVEVRRWSNCFTRYWHYSHVTGVQCLTWHRLRTLKPKHVQSMKWLNCLLITKKWQTDWKMARPVSIWNSFNQEYMLDLRVGNRVKLVQLKKHRQDAWLLDSFVDWTQCYTYIVPI